MKTITSAGGPYIIIDEANVRWWGANEKKTFSSAASLFPDDYEAAGSLTDGIFHPPCNISKLCGERGEALLITMPFEIGIVCSKSSCVYIAQVEYANPDWSLSEVQLSMFKDASFDEQVPFISSGTIYTLFDSACLPREIGNECLSFELSSGKYRLYSAMHQPDQRTGLFLYKIEAIDI